MLRSDNHVIAKQEFIQLVNGMLAEKISFDRELRSHHREPLVRPVVVRYEDDQMDEHHCVSRNISATGICLISQFACPVHQTAILELYQLKNMPVEVIAECRWCRPFGPDYWMSGWQFVTIKK